MSNSACTCTWSCRETKRWEVANRKHKRREGGMTCSKGHESDLKQGHCIYTACTITILLPRCAHGCMYVCMGVELWKTALMCLSACHSLSVHTHTHRAKKKEKVRKHCLLSLSSVASKLIPTLPYFSEYAAADSQFSATFQPVVSGCPSPVVWWGV